MEGVSHSVEVTAGTLFEAVTEGLAANQESDWVASVAQGLNVVKVSVANVRVEHEVKMPEFKKWLERAGRLAAEIGSRKRVREILGPRCSM
jgi:hypothetical protein